MTAALEERNEALARVTADADAQRNLRVQVLCD
jgi:hypothetical protein